MRNSLDFTSWSGALTTLFGLVLVSLVAVGIRLVFMQTIQRRRERENRQINERLKTLIAAYKTLGGSFTGNLEVDPSHGGARGRAQVPAPGDVAVTPEQAADVEAVLPVGRELPATVAERRRRIRDAVEAALSDVILLGTEEQVRLAAQAAQDMVAGRVVLVGPLVASLRTFIREALDLEPMPTDLVVPPQGPARPAASGGAGARGGNAGQGAAAGAGRAGGAGGGGAGGGGGGAMAGGAGMGMGLGAAGLQAGAGDEPIEPRPPNGN